LVYLMAWLRLTSLFTQAFLSRIEYVLAQGLERLKREQQFERAEAYANQVAVSTSYSHSWRGLSLIRAREPSAEVTFVDFERNLLNLTLTGTKSHEAKFADVYEGCPTYPGEVLRVPAGASGVFAFDAIGEGEDSLICLFDKTLFEAYCPDICGPNFSRGELIPSAHRKMPNLASALSMLGEELASETARGPLFAETIIRLLAMELAANAWSIKPIQATSRRFSSQQLKAVNQLLSEPLGGDISLSAMAAHCGMPVGFFMRAFKEHFGRTPYSHVNELRLLRAAHLLSTTTLPMSQIALETGFYDQQHLSKAVRKRFGRTPSEIRRSAI
jgi:AraC family transcriptional regulator